jgi:hypothetical protein
MNGNMLFKLIVTLSGILVFNIALFSAEIVAPTGIRWDLVDMENTGKIARISGKIGDGYMFLFSTGNTSLINVVANPDISDLVNKTPKCIKWLKLPSMNGWASFETNDKSNYIDVSKWENLSLDIRIEDDLLVSMQLDVYTYDLINGVSVKTGSKYLDMRVGEIGKSPGSWYTANFDLSKIVLSKGVAKLDNIQKIILTLNPCNCNTCNSTVYVDNLRLTRSFDISGVNDAVENKFNIYPVPVNNTIQITGVDGEVTIYNTIGVTVFHINDLLTKAIDVSNLECGFYIIKTKLGSQRFFKN